VKLLCFGDVHLGAGADYGAASGERLRDQHVVLETIVAEAIERNVDAILFAGDAFERRSPTPSELMVWARFTTVMREEGIPLFSIAGNHDVSHAELPTGMEVVGSTARHPEVHELGDGVGLAVLPWTPPGRLVAAAGGGDRDSIHERAAELLLRSAAGLKDASHARDRCILLAHWSVSGASLPNGLPTDDLREPVLELGELEALGFEAIVLGHIHKPQMLGESGRRIFYTGSPLPLNFGEADSQHGYWLLDTETWLSEFVVLESRPFITVDLEIDDQGVAIIDEALEDAVVRVRYKATAEQARRVDHRAIRDAVYELGAHKLYAIQREIFRSGRARVEGASEALDENQAFALWLESQDVTDPLRQRAFEQHAGYLGAVADA
jgi:exonuclease SbcD